MMPGILTETSCPKCGYEQAMLEHDGRTEEETFLCYRCGFYSDTKLDREKSLFPDDIVWDHKEEGGMGTYFFKIRGDARGQWGPVDEELVKKLKTSLHKCSVCRYTFNRNGQWFIKDLINEKERPFSSNFFWDESDWQFWANYILPA